MCERFSCLPSQLLEEDAELLRLVSIVALGTPEQPSEEPPDLE